VIHDPGTNFASQEFRDNAKVVGTEVKEMPVEAHNSIGLVERYHVPLKRAFKIISSELPDLHKEERLQMSIKAVNDTAGPDGLTPTLLVFGAYPRLTSTDAPAASIIERAAAIKLAMADVRKCHAARKVSEALRMRNGPRTSHLMDLSIDSEVLVWREGKGWKGPYRLLAMDGQTCQLDLPHGPTSFRSTSVKPYYRTEAISQTENPPEVNIPLQPLLEEEEQQPEPVSTDSTIKPHPFIVTRNPRIAIEIPRFRPNPDSYFLSVFITSTSLDEIFLTEKEARDRQLSVELRTKGIITTPGDPFQYSRRKEIDGLVARGVFQLIPRDSPEIKGTRIFGSRLVDEVKGKETTTPYEKSRLVIQAFNDEGKKEVLTQSPTIQRISQRAIIALAPSLFQMGIRIHLRDITQAYVQSVTKLARTIYALPPKDMVGELPPGMIFKVIKPLYGVPEAGTHWFGTYHRHHRVKLGMETSTYDPCLLITKGIDAPFGVVGMQTDDTLILGDEEFVRREDTELKKAQLLAKPAELLTRESSLIFNGCKLVMDKSGPGISMIQKDQGKQITLIDVDRTDFKTSYLEQRARGAYIGTICQPEASYDLSVAAQHQDPGLDEVKALNKRLQWQLKNQSRGLHFISLNLPAAKLFVFVDGSFANNKDYSSQIGYVIVLGNESYGDGEFELNGNLIHWSSTKCKRITRSVLASELYAMASGVDVAISLSTTFNLITQQLKINNFPTIICTDSFSLYECLVKLGTTKEKRLMIDIMAMRQSYERRELSEVRWIGGNNNPADAMTKSVPNNSLEELVSTNHLTVKVEGWVQRPEGATTD
jgi:hypothetical protein